MDYAHAEEATAEVHAPPDKLFDHLDAQVRAGTHMEKPSMMMMGGRMTYEFDAAQGRALGSVIKMGGSFLGIRLFVEEVVIERDPSGRKVWETRGRPRLAIIGAYRMGFEITPAGERSTLRVFIEYDSPPSPIGRVLGAAFAPFYARWCVDRMAGEPSSWLDTLHLSSK